MSKDDRQFLVDTDIGLGLAFVAMAKLLEERGALKMSELGAYLLAFAEAYPGLKKSDGTVQILRALANQLLAPRLTGACDPPKFTLAPGGKADKED